MRGGIGKILGPFTKANRVIDEARRDVARNKPKDEVSDRRQKNQKQGGGKK